MKKLNLEQLSQIQGGEGPPAPIKITPTPAQPKMVMGTVKGGKYKKVKVTTKVKRK